jgi:hypothetical protein
MNNTITTHYIFGTTRNILLGAGISYAFSKHKYTHIPIIFLFPSIYAGYHIYENKEAVKHFLEIKSKS